ncbi:PREDICTED: sister chromatid cohesion 1 protein 1 [Camelina sativa]|uniref:Sister chromatid cohesion 1 protein 1 n=2 Tax=Camelina sativa TaxID=90675 RepID=A0ABM0TAW4_CAMSA|nr:PREDICTED: sister chromatid cohesion 1 protein 1 [Camelina sativa]
MFYSHQLLARKAPLGQIWMAATLHAKINRKKLDKLDIIQICEEILNPSVPMALRLSSILMGGVVIVYERKVKLLFDDVNRLVVEINGAWRTKAVPDPTLLPKGRTHARKEAVTLPENEEADFGDFEQSRNAPKFGNYMDFQQTYISMRLDESNVNNNPEPEDLGQQFYQADAENITLFEYHGSFQTNNGTYDRFERFDIEGDDETQMNFNPREGAEIPTTLIPSPPRQQEQDIPEGVNPTSPQRQEHGRDEFAEQREKQNIRDREKQDRPQPAKKRTRKTATLEMDYEQTIIAGHVYQSWLQDTSHILCRGEKRKVRGTIRPEMKIFKRANMPPTQLLENHVDSSYPPQLYELWTKSTQVLKTSSSETRLPDFCGEQSPGFVEERMQNQHQTNHHQGSDTSSQNLGSPAERLRTIYTGKGASVESMMAGSRASPETINRQAADITVTPFYSGDDVRSMPSTPSACGAASINNIEISSRSRRSNLKRPNSSPRRGLEPVAEERPWEHHEYDFEFSIIPEKRFRADSEILFETGSAETQNPACNQSDEKITDSIKSHLKTHFETPGAPQVESLNKLAVGMDRNAAAKLFFQSCVLATRGVIKVNQTQPYGDILIARGPNM